MIWGESPLFSETSTLVSGKLRCFFSLSVSIHLTTGRKKKSRLRQGGRLSRGTTKPGSSGSSLPSKRLTYPHVAPENRPLEKGDLFWKPMIFRGEMLVFREGIVANFERGILLCTFIGTTPLFWLERVYTMICPIHGNL